MKKGVILLAILLILLTACQSTQFVCTDGSVVDNPSACPTEEEEEVVEEEIVEEEYTQQGGNSFEATVGQSITVNDIKVTVSSVEWAESYTYYSDIYDGDYTEEAGPGRIFVIVKGLIENNGAGSQFIGAGDFSMVTGDGQVYDSDVSLDPEEMEYYIDMFEGDKLRGTIYFEIPDTASDVKLRYTFDYYDGSADRAEWSLDR